jgi:hypothetical protein
MRTNSFLLLAVTALSVALTAACDGEDGGTSDTPATATAEPTRADTTGIEAVDRVLTAVKNGDPVAFVALLRPQTIPCTSEFGAGGPPKCFNAPGNDLPEGTPVDVFPYGTCELEWQFDLGVFTERFLERLGPLYAVVRLDEFASVELLAANGYGLIYEDAAPRETGTARAILVTDAGIVGAQTLCGAGEPASGYLAVQGPMDGAEVILEGPAFAPPSEDLTGMEAVDRVLSAITSGDRVGFEALLVPQELACSYDTGIGGPPYCGAAPNMPAEGTAVSVFPYDTCEREWQFDLGDFTTRILERINDLYAVVRIDPVTPTAELAEGAYGIIYPDATGFATSHALIVTDNGIVSVDSLCGGTADAFLDDGPPFYGPELILEGPAFN